MAEVDPPLDAVALADLATALAGSFNADELSEAVLVDLNEDIYVVYAAADAAIGPLTTALLKGLQQRGWIVRFFRFARRRRPDNAPLIATIQRYCASAMQDAPPAIDDVAVLVEVLALIKARLADADIASAVRAVRGDLVLLATGLSRLRIYKSLHDVLQKCQVSQFSLLMDNIRRLRADPQAAVSLRDLLLDLKMTFDKTRRTLRSLEATQDDAEEKDWIDGILSAVSDISAARDRLDDRKARIAALRIRDLIQSQPSRINGMLRSEARKLPLKSLSKAVAAVSIAAGLTEAQSKVFASGVASTSEIQLRLTRQVADHNRWQLVERQLWLIDALVERDASSIAEFAEYWEIATQSLAPLWNADVHAEWVTATRNYRSSIDTALAAVPPKAEDARNVYGDFRSAALWQFYSVDGELNELCENVMEIAAPITALVEGIPDD